MQMRTVAEQYTLEVPEGATHYTGVLSGLHTFFRIPESKEVHIWNQDRWFNIDIEDTTYLKKLAFVDIQANTFRYTFSIDVPEGATHYGGVIHLLI